jgi:hypothetical protein
MSNDNLVLVCGESATGKSACLRNIKNPEGVMYLNCEAGKKLPFPAKFKKMTITDPLQVPAAFAQAEAMPEIHTIVVDSLTFLMDMYESLHVLPSANTMGAWSDYAQFFKNLMQQNVASSTKNVIFIAHTLATYSEENMAMEVKVPIKGALKNNGLEAYFSTVISTKRVPLKKLEGYESGLLTITEEEEELGFKYCFQTKITKETVSERIRAPMGMFSNKQTYADNDIQVILDHLHNYYQ